MKSLRTKRIRKGDLVKYKGAQMIVAKTYKFGDAEIMNIVPMRELHYIRKW